MACRVGLLQVEDQRHQRLGDEAAAIDAEMAALVGAGAERIGLLHGHAAHRLGSRELCVRGARGADEGADLVRVLFARRAFDARGHIDARRARDAQRLGDIAGVEPARQHERHARIDALEQRPVERRAEPARPRRVLRRAARTAAGRRPSRKARSRARSLALGDRQRLHHRQAEARAHRRHALGRLGAVQLQHVGLERLDDGGAASHRRHRPSARPCRRGRAPARPARARPSSARLRGLGGKNTKPTMSAPASSAASSASGVFRPQILTIRAIVRRVLPPSPRRRKAEPQAR